MTDQLRFQHFEVLSKADGTPHVLGKGAMGVTYKAFDTNLHSMVVIKVINPRLVTDETARRRFLKEAQTMARIKHGNVADVFHFGEAEDQVFYAMEFCDGPNLQEYVNANQALTPEIAFAFCKQAAGALGAIENAGLIHRDIKPSNIILVNDAQGNSQIKLIDFGLARAGHREEDLDPNLTQGGFVGTPSFASPEQLLEQADLDIRSDIYSLGVTLWFMLTGRPVFTGRQVEIMFNHVNAPPPWDRLPELDGGMFAVLKKMIEKARDERYLSATALWQSLDELQRKGLFSEVRGLPGFDDSRASEARGSLIGKSGYEILKEMGETPEGRLFKARDFVTGDLVSLRYLSQRFSDQPELFECLRNEALRLKRLQHPNVIAVLDFQRTDSGIQLVTQWLDCPTLLDFLKSRQQVEIAEVAGFLVQVADGFDFLIEHQLTQCETEFHKIKIVLPDGLASSGGGVDASQILHAPIDEWGDYRVKINPLAVSLSVDDYASLGGTAPTGLTERLFEHFLAIVHRILGGIATTQTHGYRDYTSLPSLRAEGNEVLERHMMADRRSEAPVSCKTVLVELFEAEDVDYQWSTVDSMSPGDIDEGDMTLDSSLVAPGDGSASGPVQGGAQIPGLTGVVDPRNSAVASGYPGSAVPASFIDGVGSGYGSQPMGSPSAVGSSAFSSEIALQQIELEKRRAGLEAETEKLKQRQVFENQMSLLANERQLIEQQRRELEEREKKRIEYAEKERQSLEAERRKLESVTAELEQKKTEHERLEHELRLRQQMEFARLQEEREEWEQQHQQSLAQANDLIQRREEEFMLKQQRALEKLAAERNRLDSLQAGVDGDVRQSEESARALQSASEDAARLQAESDSLRERQKELEERLQSKDKELVAARRELKEASDALEARRCALEEERERLHRQAEEKIAATAAAEEEQRRQLAQRQEEVEQRARQREQELEDKLARAQRAIDEAEAGLRTKESELQRLRDQESDVRRADSGKIEELQREVEAGRARLDQAHSQFASERSELDSHDRQVDEQAAKMREEASRLAAEAEQRLAESQEAARVQEEALLQRERQLEEEWSRLEEAKAGARAELGLELDEERNQLAEERRQLAEAAAALEDQKRSQLAGQREMEEQARQAYERERQRLEEEAEAFRRQIDAEKQQVLEASRLRSEREDEEHRRRMAEHSAEFESLERDKLQRLEALEAEIADREKAIESQRQDVFRKERVNDEVLRRSHDFDEATERELEKEMARIGEEREQLDIRIEQLRKAEKKRLVMIVCGIVLATVTASTAGYYIKGKLVNVTDQDAEKTWQMEQAVLQSHRQAEDLEGIINWSAGVELLFSDAANFRAGGEAAGGEGELNADALERYREFFGGKRQDVEQEARQAVMALSKAISSNDPPAFRDREKLLRSINAVATWGKVPEAALLRAQLSMPVDVERSDYPAAIETFVDAVTVDDSFAAQLQDELRTTLTAALDDFDRDAQLSNPGLLLQRLSDLPTGSVDGIAELPLLKALLLSDEQRSRGNFSVAVSVVVDHLIGSPAGSSAILLRFGERVIDDLAARNLEEIEAGMRELARLYATPGTFPEDGHPGRSWMLKLAGGAANSGAGAPLDGLRVLLFAVSCDESLSDDIRPFAQTLTDRLADQKAGPILAARDLLVAVGERWKLADVYMALGDNESESQQRFDWFRQAAEHGSMEGLAHAGRYLVAYGTQNNISETVAEGVEALEKSAAADDPTGLYLLSELYFGGVGVPQDADKTIQLAGRAAELGHPSGKLILGQGLLLKAEESADEALYRQAEAALREAAEAGQSFAYFYLFVSLNNATRQDLDAAMKALEDGAVQGDANCQFRLGAAFLKGEHFEQNLSKGRELVMAAARQRHPSAIDWCRREAERIRESGNAEERKWVEDNQQVWSQ